MPSVYLQQNQSASSKPLTYFIFILFNVNGCLMIYNSLNRGDNAFFYIGILNLSLSAIYLILLFRPELFKSPGILIDKNTIRIREKYFRKAWSIDWEKVSSITFNSYEIIFKTEEGSQGWSYNSTAEVSLKIKELLREEASEKGITISPST